MDAEMRSRSRMNISTVDWDDRRLSQSKDLSGSALSNIKSLLQTLPATKTHPLARYKTLETAEQICAALQQGCVPATHSLDPASRTKALQMAYEVMHCKWRSELSVAVRMHLLLHRPARGGRHALWEQLLLSILPGFQFNNISVVVVVVVVVLVI